MPSLFAPRRGSPKPAKRREASGRSRRLRHPTRSVWLAARSSGTDWQRRSHTAPAYPRLPRARRCYSQIVPRATCAPCGGGSRDRAAKTRCLAAKSRDLAAMCRDLGRLGSSSSRLGRSSSDLGSSSSALGRESSGRGCEPSELGTTSAQMGDRGWGRGERSRWQEARRRLASTRARSSGETRVLGQPTSLAA